MLWLWLWLDNHVEYSKPSKTVDGVITQPLHIAVTAIADTAVTVVIYCNQP